MDIKSTIRDCIRTLKVARKPTKDSLLTSLKVTLLGFFLVGFIGFVIKSLVYILTKYAP
ncbi:MAG: protein translocase SEC61 complex subunit gamma [Thermoproteota archaeon]|nr:MAG: protein translocase SEC61 complex subunit gamma [Candidatus Korarchaeota archaeon]HDN02016.1 protein translocase SEC61 complex subunit gamma [Candidatus Bathyarchaeota archaeon]